jgi:hypothetical protein
MGDDRAIKEALYFLNGPTQYHYHLLRALQSQNEFSARKVSKGCRLKHGNEIMSDETFTREVQDGQR